MEVTLLHSLDDICETVRNTNARGVKNPAASCEALRSKALKI